ncbi:MAG: putative CRISPR-associated protein [Phormidium sp. BM_Day4_Bin.17]|nr:putative CRISPR-associated protein [Phormidium sp. BM_Day4_Bin.17]UCJ11086.1 MAG: putative CRISPR-associated protein [Phormidium sp. PBR-2020]
MIKTIVCSVGTSAARNLGIRPNDLANWVESKSSLELAATEMFESFQNFEPTEESHLTQNLSAEIHSLVRIGINSSDRVLLFASETPDGHCCALAVQTYLQHYWPGIEVKTESIPGLQVNDAEKFRNQGVVEFVKKVTQAIDAYGNVILNPTGGFKALVPYTVLLGMLKGVKCDYIFERSTSLLELPPLPVEFRRSQFEAYKEIFEIIDRDSYISQQDWENRVPYQERLLLDPLIETSDEGITLSAIGFLFLDAMQRPSNLVPFLSRKAIDDCFDNLSTLDDCDPFRYLTRVASSADALQQAQHISMGQGLWWLKPGRTTDRYLVSVEGWRLLVWRAIREDQEGEKYAKTVQVNPERDRRKYLPFIRMEYLNQ